MFFSFDYEAFPSWFWDAAPASLHYDQEYINAADNGTCSRNAKEPDGV